MGICKKEWFGDVYFHILLFSFKFIFNVFKRMDGNYIVNNRF